MSKQFSLETVFAIERRVGANIGLYYMLLQAFCFFMRGLFQKHLSEYSCFQVVFMRSLLILLPSALCMQRAGLSLFPQDRNTLATVLGRALLGFLSTSAGHVAISNLRLTEAYCLFYTAPIWTSLMGYFLLEEKLSWHQAINIVNGMVGVLLIVRPRWLFQDNSR